MDYRPISPWIKTLTLLTYSRLYFITRNKLQFFRNIEAEQKNCYKIFHKWVHILVPCDTICKNKLSWALNVTWKLVQDASNGLKKSQIKKGPDPRTKISNFPVLGVSNTFTSFKNLLFASKCSQMPLNCSSELYMCHNV